MASNLSQDVFCGRPLVLSPYGTPMVELKCDSIDDFLLLSGF